MKRIILALGLTLIAATLSGQVRDKDGHTLVSQWKSYYKAVDADLPQDQLKALEDIKEEAKNRHLAWDWYDAATRYVRVRTNINWKDRDKQRKAMAQEVVSLDEPVITYTYYYDSWNTEETRKFIKDNESRLKLASNTEFYSRDSRINSVVYAPVLPQLIKNDYEFVLWSAYLGRRVFDIREYVKDRYPEAPLTEYTEISRYWYKSTYGKLEEYVKNYEGKAVSLLARQRMIDRDFRELNNSKTAKSKDYKELRAKAESFERDRKRYTGNEKLIADCCKGAESLIKTLDEKSIDITVKDSKATLVLRNVSSLTLQVLNASETEPGMVLSEEELLFLGAAKAPQPVWKTQLTNRTASYYVQDTLRTNIPDLNDGVYTILCKSGTYEAQTNWRKHSLSISVRPDSKGWCAFVTDYFTGEPVKTCDLLLTDSDGNSIAIARNFRPNGFTRLPDEIQNRLTGNRDSFKLCAQYTDRNGILRLSGYIGITGKKTYEYNPYEGKDVTRALIITDRSAFNPGETVQFKTVCYTGTYDYTLAPENSPLTVKLINPEGETIDSKDLTTNEFGSAAGAFLLPAKGSRGGIYTLRVEQGQSSLESTSIRVDEFVLPTFELSWDEDNTLYLWGDRIKVSGRIRSYSGHSLGNATVRYTVGLGGGLEDTSEIKPDTDGRFSFDFLSSATAHYWAFPVSVTVTDGTGETLRFSTYRYVFYEIPLSLALQNEIPGSYTLPDSNRQGTGGIVRDDTADLLVSVRGLDREGLEISYKITYDANGKKVAAGAAEPGETVRIPIAKLPSGLYRVEAIATAKAADGSKVESRQTSTFIKASDSDTALNMAAVSFFKELDSDDIALQIGTTDGPAWVAIELFGSGNKLLDSQLVKLSGARGKAGSLKTVSYARRAGWPESLKLCALFFHKGNVYRYTRSIELPTTSLAIPLEFTRFTDKARPGEECTLLIKTEPGVECAVTVFDKATETIRPNRWYPVSASRRPEPIVSYSSKCGVNANDFPFYSIETRNGMVYKSASMLADAPVEMMAETAQTDNAVSEGDSNEPAVRENFGATMAWEPFLRSGQQGDIELKIKGSDRLSTYYVQLFAHGAGMRNANIRRELQVTIPVKLSLVEPKYLYENDLYVASATVASNLEQPVTGRVAIRFYDGRDWRSARVLGTMTERITLPAGGATGIEARFSVPEGLKELGVLLNFVPDDETDGADAMFVSIPVYKPFQTLTEAHSALLRNPADRERTVAVLREQFVNLDASSLEPQERSILDMIREAIPDKVEPHGNDVLSLTEAWYANVLARRLGATGLDGEALKEIKDKISACQNQGGGIGWFEGMQSSPILTATVLQRIAAMPEEGESPVNVEAAVRYLDASRFDNTERPWWSGGISLEKYLQTRAMYASVPFEPKASAKDLKQFRKDVKAYLTPAKKRGLNGQILAKARRLRTLQMLDQSAEGQKLAKAWGLSLKSSVRKSMNADIKSLLQYAVEHKSGGYYYPNAVMPWRGLLESELYAHALLCDLLSDFINGQSIAEGIRLWLMVQKETQHWDTDASYLEALASVLRGTQETLATSVISLSGSFTKPFTEVLAAGNGFTVSCSWYSGDKALQPGDVLRVGDKVTARYSVWSEENRSFVRLTAPRPASFRPVAQLSGHYGWWLAPLSYGGYSFTPQGYRNVLSDKTEYWFDSYPEENTTVTEEFFVTQEGAFQVPAIEIESLYAPHYRANGPGREAVVSE